MPVLPSKPANHTVLVHNTDQLDKKNNLTLPHNLSKVLMSNTNPSFNLSTDSICLLYKRIFH